MVLNNATIFEGLECSEFIHRLKSGSVIFAANAASHRPFKKQLRHGVIEGIDSTLRNQDVLLIWLFICL